MTNKKASLEHPLVMAFKNPETDADVELWTAVFKNAFPEVAMHAKSSFGKNGAASVSQSGYEKAAMSSRISLISNKM